MPIRGITRALAVIGLVSGIVVLTAAWAQGPPASAKIDTAALDLHDPDRFLIPAVLEPIRKVTIVATADGILRSQDARAGASVRDGQEVAQLDRLEASARLKIAQAVVKELQAACDELKGLSSTLKSSLTQAQARLEAAQARVELAQLDLDRCTLRAPFAGRVIDSRFSDGQFVDKGAVIAELADISSLRTFIPVARAGATVGGILTISVEGQAVSAKVQALLPLPESLAALRELSTPLTAAWVVVPNPTGALEPGQRVVSPVLPTLPVATIASHALLKGEEQGGPPIVQVIRNEYVANVKVRVLGNPRPDRVQVTGTLRPNDSLIVSTSVPLLAGTLIRFTEGGSGKIEPTTPNPAESGETADLTPPRGDAKRTAAKAKPSTKPSGSAPGPATKGDGKSVPF